MAIDTTSPRTRRAILMGALGGTVAAVAAAVGRASPVGATDGDFVRVGHSYSSTSGTEINGTGRGAAFFTSSDLGVAFEGSSDSGTGVHGMSTRGLGVGGSSVHGTGVSGSSDSGIGVRGASRIGLGVEGRSRTSTAIHGVSSTTFVNSSTTPDNTGVYGYADQDASSVGVEGHSVSGTGVEGHSVSGTGVEGHSGSGLGVFGLSTETTAVYGRSRAKYGPAVVGVSDRGGTTGVQGFSGYWKLLPDAPRNTGVHGYADLDDTAVGVVGESFQGTGGLFIAPKGTSLRATGRVQLDNCSGVASIASGANSVHVSPGYPLVASSSVVATLRGNPSGPTTVKSVSVDPGSNTFTIHLTANAAGTLSVAWHVFG